MDKALQTHLTDIIREHEAQILSSWLEHQRAAGTLGSGLVKEAEVREQSRQFLGMLQTAMHNGNLDLMASQWAELRDMLTNFSTTRAQQGFTPSQTAMFIFSLKQPIFEILRQELADNAKAQADEIWTVTLLLDKLGLFTTEAYQKSREEVIGVQQQELLELSTPVVRLWEGVLALPLIGTLDSQRTQVVMESLLEKIVQTGSDIAIIDITGVPVVDTQVAQHLLKTVSAARLMGGDCIISGIRPQIAQTIVHLGVELGSVVTKSTLADAFAVALKRRGLTVQTLKNGL
jgi:rsbT co-antagonist protein RsbR